MVNIGGKAKFIYDFAKKENKEIKKIYLNKRNKIDMQFDSSINLSKLKKLIK